MSAASYDDLREHIGHEIECVCYGRPGEAPQNVALECVECSEVLLSFDHWSVEPDTNGDEHDA